jgi:uncharacterized protein
VKHLWPNRPLILYGVSMGAAAVMRAVGRDGVQADAVILESPFSTMVDAARNRFRAMGLPTFPSAELLVFWGSIQQGYNGFDNNPVDYARSINVPALLMHGDQDLRVTVEQTNAIYERLGGVKQLVSFPGVGHSSLIAAAADKWKGEVKGFLDDETKLR